MDYFSSQEDGEKPIIIDGSTEVPKFDETGTIEPSAPGLKRVSPGHPAIQGDFPEKS